MEETLGGHPSPPILEQPLINPCSLTLCSSCHKVHQRLRLGGARLARRAQRVPHLRHPGALLACARWGGAEGGEGGGDAVRGAGQEVDHQDCSTKGSGGWGRGERPRLPA